MLRTFPILGNKPGTKYKLDFPDRVLNIHEIIHTPLNNSMKILNKTETLPF